MLIALIVIIAIIVVFFVFIMRIYNRLVTLRNRYKNSFAQIDVQLKRRYDLIPNLVETAKTYMKYEKETLEAVINARNAAFKASNLAASNPANADAIKSLIGAETALGGAMGKLMAVVEGYPDLKADKHMSQLMEELTSTENRIAFARQAYNDAVMTYNTGREKFPDAFIANTFNFKEAPLFVIEEATEREAPKVSFS